MRKELFLIGLIYIVSMSVLLMAIYRFFESWQFSDFHFFIAGGLVLLVAVGWGYILTAVIFAPQKQIEDALTMLTKDIMHELNVPLSTIQANTSLLKKSPKDEKSLIRLQRIEDASLRLERLYQELVYTIKKEMHEIEKEMIDIKTVVEERVAVFQEQQRNPFEVDVNSYSIKVDKIGFEQMIDNIIGNAMKYSDKESLITISLKEDSLYIEDRGIGMSTSELLRMHERYFQGDKTQEGQGIGLALVKAYCDQENIQIQIKSKKGKGVKVCLNLSAVHT